MEESEQKIDQEGMRQSLNYIYGFKSAGNQQLYFINNDDIYLGKSSTESKKINCNSEIQKCKDIKKFFIDNINVIYNSQYKNNSREPLLISQVITKKAKKTNGGNPEIKFILPKDDKGDAYVNLYNRIDDKNTKRSIFTTTREIDEVNLLVLCYFHIDDFDMTIPCDYSEIGCENTTEQIRTFNKKYYQIISEQEALHKTEFEEAVRKIKDNQPIHPVNIDVERDSDGNNTYYLSDGNHRIAALKALGYQGYVPAYVCSYIPEFKLKSYLIPGNDCVCEDDEELKRKHHSGGNKTKGRRILKSYSYL